MTQTPVQMAIYQLQHNRQNLTPEQIKYCESIIKRFEQAQSAWNRKLS